MAELICDFSEPRNRAAYYNDAFPNRPGLSCNTAGTMVGGTWTIGACYKNPNRLYGAYPHGYLERVHTMFPDARHILHVFSGGLTEEDAVCAAWPDTKAAFDQVHLATGRRPIGIASADISMTLVDSKGPDEYRYPTWKGDVQHMPITWADRFDLIIADVPYSKEDAGVYGVPMPNIRLVLRELRRVASPEANLVWLDQKWPMHRKDQWKTWAQIGLVRSTHHRMRLVTMFRAV